MKIVKPYRILLGLALLLITTLVLTACPTERLSPSFTRSGVMRDTIFSVEERGLGAVMVWVTHSDKEGYCFTNSEQAATARSLVREHAGEVLIEYRAAGVLDSLNPCARTENDPQYVVYLGESIKAVPSR
ncbi:MAG: hypothetical protein R3C14_38540 [Caldilineaceae bacterium]